MTSLLKLKDVGCNEVAVEIEYCGSIFRGCLTEVEVDDDDY